MYHRYTICGKFREGFTDYLQDYNDKKALFMKADADYKNASDAAIKARNNADDAQTDAYVKDDALEKANVILEKAIVDATIAQTNMDDAINASTSANTILQQYENDVSAKTKISNATKAKASTALIEKNKAEEDVKIKQTDYDNTIKKKTTAETKIINLNTKIKELKTTYDELKTKYDNALVSRDSANEVLNKTRTSGNASVMSIEKLKKTLGEKQNLLNIASDNMNNAATEQKTADTEQKTASTNFSIEIKNVENATNALSIAKSNLNTRKLDLITSNNEDTQDQAVTITAISKKDEANSKAQIKADAVKSTTKILNNALETKNNALTDIKKKKFDTNTTKDNVKKLIILAKTAEKNAITAYNVASSALVQFLDATTQKFNDDEKAKTAKTAVAAIETSSAVKIATAKIGAEKDADIKAANEKIAAAEKAIANITAEKNVIEKAAKIAADKAVVDLKNRNDTIVKQMKDLANLVKKCTK